jgi:hypothetical protein
MLFDSKMVLAFDRSSLDYATVGNVLLDGTIRGLARFDGSCERFCQRLGQCIDHLEPEGTIDLCLEAAKVIRDAVRLGDHHTVQGVLIPLQRLAVTGVRSRWMGLLELLPRPWHTPALGRDFLASDDQPSSQATVILSNAFWKRRLGSDPAIIGKTILLDAKPYTVIGVMPSSFTFPDPKTQLWTAASHEGSRALLTTFEDHPFWAIARLRPGATLRACSVSSTSFRSRSS